MRLYLDSSPIIYLVEDVSPYAPLVRARLAEEDVIAVSSELARLECRVVPLRTGNLARLQDFDEFFRSLGEVLELTRSVVDQATEIRARYAFPTPDSLHLAAAVWGGCDAFLTNDRRLQQFRGITVEQL